MHFRMETKNVALLYARNDDDDLVKRLVKMKVNVNRNEALFEVIRRGHIKWVEYFLEAGADVNVVQLCGCLALMVATLIGNVECLNLLIAAGADVNKFCIYQSERQQAMAIVASGKKPGYNGNIRSMMHHAEYGDDYRAAHGNRSFTAVMLAASSDNHEYVEVLIDAGADVNEADGYYCEKSKQVNLMNICREAIRYHLLKLDQHENLFVRIPRLGLPEDMSNYLLHRGPLAKAPQNKSDLIFSVSYKSFDFEI